MSKRIYHLAPCPDYDLERTESWLQDMAKEGWFLSKDGFIFGFAVFEQRTACHTMRYRLEAAVKKRSWLDDNGGDPDYDSVELFEHMGWEYICSRGQFYIYASSDANAPELNTDPEVQTLTIKALQKRQKGYLHSLIFWFLIYPAFGARFTVISAATLAPLIFGYFSLEILRRLWKEFKAVRHSGKLRKKLQNGEDLNHQKDWKSGATKHRLTMVYEVVSVVLVVTLIFTLLGNHLDPDDQKLKDYTDPIPFPLMEDFVEGDLEYEYYGDWSNVIQRTDSLLADDIIELNENCNVSMLDGRHLDGGLDVLYFDCRWNCQAQLIAREQLLYCRMRTFDEYLQLELPQYDLDYLVAFRDVFPTVIMVKDDVMIKATFYQTSQTFSLSLEEWASIYAESICTK